MKRRLVLSPAASDALAATATVLRRTITDTILDLVADPEPIGARPYGSIPGAMEITGDAYRIVYTHGADHVSVWIIQPNT
ncbi:hypothetical protein GCM10010156_66020 [Planobispora rosea]|uniref:Uncharacterized protein n=1 Tax=Planobispora rosea TaxID=35762 RepID=A0A8J3S8I3_PLARO|nr:hypothetical protein [Planobispora rosea]GGS98691.1 hypothetical protein GCM10010156_66020 [Planobispora rosea]GIH87966.1 hypothetical protein Pro02_63740 [Planobispora rosea]